MTNVTTAVASLLDQPDLYSALRRAGAGLKDADIEAFLTRTLADLPALPGGQAVADRLLQADQALLRAILRSGAGLPAVPGAVALRDYLKTIDVAPLFQPPMETAPTMALLTAGEQPDMPAFSDRAFDDWFARQGVPYGLGAYGEHRTVYDTPQFEDAASNLRRTVHTGIDVFAPAGTPVFAPFAGRVVSVSYNADPLDYGHTLFLEHAFGEQVFWTLYGHLGATLPQLCRVGDGVVAGQHIADLGDWHENGGWAAHLHFQVMSTLLDQRQGNFFGVGHANLWDVWADICPDPNLILRLDPSRFLV